MKQTLIPLLVLGGMLAGCNQPFEPTGPVDSKLVIYAILNSSTDTQYVRVATTFGPGTSAEVRDASVRMTGNGTSVVFRDTTVMWRDTLGNPTPTNVYVGYGSPMAGGVQYLIEASTPSGLSSSATVTALKPPSFSLQSVHTAGFFVLDTRYLTDAGAAVMHFYIDFYALVNNGWELHTAEIPLSRSTDPSGNDVFNFMTFATVPALSAGGNQTQIDSSLFQVFRSRVYSQYAPAPVVFLDIRFTLTQIDDPLYDYYYITNGPVDRSTIRLDVPDFTNVREGYGVCGSRAEVDLIFPLVR